MTPEAKETIRQAFEGNPDKEMLIATSDGQCFTNKGLANLHAKGLHDSEIKVVVRKDYVVETAEEEILGQAEGEPEAPSQAEETNVKEQTNKLDTTGAVVKLTSEQRIERINEVTSIEELELLLKDEKAKTVIEAGKLKRESLTDH